jgi:hypothetical protein
LRWTPPFLRSPPAVSTVIVRLVAEAHSEAIQLDFIKPVGTAWRAFGWRGKARTHVHAGVIQQTPRGKKKDRTGGRGGPSLVSRRLSVELLGAGEGRSST